MSIRIRIDYDSSDRARDVRAAARQAELANPRPRPATFKVKKGKGSYRRNVRSNVTPLRFRDEDA